MRLGVLTLAVALTLASCGSRPPKQGAVEADDLKPISTRFSHHRFLLAKFTTLEEARRLAQQREPLLGRAPFSEIVIAPAPEHLRLYAFGATHFENVPSILDNLEAVAKSGTPGAALRVLRFRGITVMTYRGPHPYPVGQPNVVNEVMGSGADPTLIEHGGLAMRILRITGTDDTLHVYIRTPTMPGCDSAELLATKLRTMLKSDEIVLQMRTDAWFSEEDFPLVHPFAPDNEGHVHRSLPSGKFVVPPRVREYYRALPELIFERRSSRETCVLYGVQERTYRTLSVNRE
jgi:hypothetical protein